MKNYKSLYRKYRPTNFAEVIGQKNITESIKNAITNNSVAHAFLFSGPRGVGKTSVARILAKSLNCPHVIEGEPCNNCVNCVEINNGNAIDVVELDAASNNGIDEIRNIKERTNYANTSMKFNVFIIDEAHMLSKAAFNALLKTLEEPSENTIFILATTEIHKIPKTIISRCQRHNFKLINSKQIIKNLSTILDKEGASYSDDALKIISFLSHGGVRDSISNLERAISFSNDVTLENVNELFSLFPISEIISFINSFKTENFISNLNNIFNSGKEIKPTLELVVQVLIDYRFFKTLRNENDLTILEVEHVSQINIKETKWILLSTLLLDVLQTKVSDPELKLLLMSKSLSDGNYPHKCEETELENNIITKPLPEQNVTNQKQQEEVENSKHTYEGLDIKETDEKTKEILINDIPQENINENAAQLSLANDQTEQEETIIKTKELPTIIEEMKTIDSEEEQNDLIIQLLQNANGELTKTLKGQWPKIKEMYDSKYATLVQKFSDGNIIAAAQNGILIAFIDVLEAEAAKVAQNELLSLELTKELFGAEFRIFSLSKTEWEKTKQRYFNLKKDNLLPEIQPINLNKESMVSVDENLNTVETTQDIRLKEIFGDSFTSEVDD